MLLVTVAVTVADAVVVLYVNVNEELDDSGRLTASPVTVVATVTVTTTVAVLVATVGDVVKIADTTTVLVEVADAVDLTVTVGVGT